MAKKVGLVLSSGAARGLAHIGVIKVLEENNIPVQHVVGSSIGALIGAAYCEKGSGKELEDLAEHFDKKKNNALFDWTVPRIGLVKGEKIQNFLKKILKKDFSELKVPLSVVATDLCEGRDFVFESGDLVEAVMASISIPVLFKPIKEKEELLVDGGLLNPLPANVLEQRGCDVIIVVDVEYKTVGREQIKPTIFNIAMNSILLTRERITELQKSHLRNKPNVVLITPNIGHVHYLDFSQGKSLIAAGEMAALEALPKIKGLLAEDKAEVKTQT